MARTPEDLEHADLLANAARRFVASEVLLVAETDGSLEVKAQEAYDRAATELANAAAKFGAYARLRNRQLAGEKV